MRAKILGSIAFLAIVLAVLTTFAGAYGRANGNSRQAMMGNGHHGEGGMHGMSEEVPQECVDEGHMSEEMIEHHESMHEGHHNATVEDDQDSGVQAGCH